MVSKSNNSHHYVYHYIYLQKDKKNQLIYILYYYIKIIKKKNYKSNIDNYAQFILYTPQGIGHCVPDIRLLDSHGEPYLLRDRVQGRKNSQRSGYAEPLLDTSLAKELWRYPRNTLQDGKVPTTSCHPTFGSRRVQRPVFYRKTIEQAHART